MPKRPSELINSTDVSPSRSGNQSNTITTLVVIVLAAVLGYLALTRIDWGRDDRKQDDHHEQKQDDKKQDDKRHDSVTVKPGYLLIVRERIDDVAASESVARIAEFASKQTDLQWRDVDKDDPSDAVQKLVQHAKSKGIDPPFLLFKSKDDNQLRGVIKLPPATASDAQIVEVFK